MKPFEMIQSLDSIISDLKYTLKYSKNKAKSEKQIKQLVSVRKNLNVMLHHSMQTDSLELLIFAYIEKCMVVEIQENVIHKYRYKEDVEIKPYDMEFYLKQLGDLMSGGASFAKSKVMAQIRLSYDCLMNEDYKKNNDTERVEKMIEKIPSEKSVSEMLTEFCKIIITNIKLKKH
jgi:hypothetical protein